MIIKKWKMFNESSEIDCDFETFKDIMSEISDSYEHKFTDYGDVEDFYDLTIQLPELSSIDHNDIYFNWSYLNDIIRPYDDPGEITGDIYKYFNQQLEQYNRLMNEIENMKSKTEKVKSIFTILENEIIPRLSHFRNFYQCSIGFDNEGLRICFDMPQD